MTVRDEPTSREKVRTLHDAWMCVTHPAFRLGLLDAQAGRPHNSDDILARIASETPAKALNDLGFSADLLGAPDVALAQWRYEEGRELHIRHGLRCKAWSWPQFPPKSVRDFIHSRFAIISEQNAPPITGDGQRSSSSSRRDVSATLHGQGATQK